MAFTAYGHFLSHLVPMAVISFCCGSSGSWGDIVGSVQPKMLSGMMSMLTLSFILPKMAFFYHISFSYISICSCLEGNTSGPERNGVELFLVHFCSAVFFLEHEQYFQSTNCVHCQFVHS